MPARPRLLPILAPLLALLAAPAAAAPDEALARRLLEELVAINTAPSGGNDTRAAMALLADTLREAGFPEEDIHVVGQSDKLANLVARYRSPSPQAEPVLMMAHLDVVEALESDWSYPPFVPTEDGGYLYGRGSSDNKAGAAILVANFVALRRAGFAPERDFILMLTADEETTGNAADWLATERRDLVDAGFALNTDGGLVVEGEDGAPLAFLVQTAEKVYVSYALTASDAGGHSSVPEADSPISQLARALVALEAHDFPINLDEGTRGFFEAWGGVVASPEERAFLAAVAASENGSAGPEMLAMVPYYNALARTTCVATQLSGGHAENALPQTARAVVNCRVLPQESTDDIEAALRALAAPHQVAVERITPVTPSPPSPLTPEVLAPVSAVAARVFGEIPVIPQLSTGATDGAFVRRAGIPVYGVGALRENPDDIRAHGRDERVGIEAFNQALRYWYELVEEIAG